MRKYITLAAVLGAIAFAAVSPATSQAREFKRFPLEIGLVKSSDLEKQRLATSDAVRAVTETRGDQRTAVSPPKAPGALLTVSIKLRRD